MAGYKTEQTATNIMNSVLLGVMPKQCVPRRRATLFPFILLKKTTLFTNSACVLKRTSGLDLTTKIRIGLGSGLIAHPGLLLTGLGWSIRGTGGSKTVVTCLLKMDQLEREVTKEESGILLSVTMNTTLYVSSLCLSNQELNLAMKQ